MALVAARCRGPLPGEHELARKQGIRSASTEAEWLVGRELGISGSQVHAICGEIRQMQSVDPESANFPEMTLAEFRECLASPEGFLLAKFATQPAAVQDES